MNHAALFHNREHLLEMPELLTGQPGHLVQQVGVVNVPVHQAERGGGGLLFAMGVIDQHQVLVRQGIVDPLLRGPARQEVVNLLQGVVHG